MINYFSMIDVYPHSKLLWGYYLLYTLQQFPLLAFLFVPAVDASGDAFAVGVSGGVFTLPEVVVDLVDAPGAPFAACGLPGLEVTLVCVGLLFRLLRHGGIGFADVAVDFHRRLLLHGIGDVGVNVQRGG